MNKWVGLSLLICVILAVVITLANRSSLTKATWIWDAQLITSQAEEIVAFAEKNEINLIYLHVEPIEVSPEAYRTFIRAANRANIQVEALGGDPQWAFTANRDSIAELIAWVKAFNNTAKADERFHGIHVDIEPYLLPEWKKNQADVVGQWMKNVTYLVAETKKDTKLRVGADLPFWIDAVPVPGQKEKVSNWMLQRLDSITLMAYRNHTKGPNGIVDIVDQILKDANTRKKESVIVGVNILESTEGNNVSFHGIGTEEMNNQLVILQEELSSHPAFAGSAIHDYESWKHASVGKE